MNKLTENPPTLAAALAGVLVAFAMWGLASVVWPDYVEAAVLALAVVVAGGIGKVASHWTKRVYYSDPPDVDAPPAAPVLNRSGTKAAWD